MDTDVTKSMAEVWSDLLAVENVELGDDFFRLGGDSLQAVELMTRIQLKFGVQMDPIEIFETPYFDQFIRLVETFRNQQAQDGAKIDGAF